jgi:hypothetical protein
MAHWPTRLASKQVLVAREDGGSENVIRTGTARSELPR